MRARHRLQRRRIYLGCEGESEQSYGTLLHQLVTHKGHLHIEAALLQPGSGDPLALVERAYYEIKRQERKLGSRYSYRAVLLDRDTFGKNPERDQKIQGIITAAEIHLIWQRPSHEALLLRHLPGCQKLQPPTSAEALARLKEHWSDYEKGVPTNYLAGRLTIENLKAAAAVEPELRIFFDSIKYF